MFLISSSFISEVEVISEAQNIASNLGLEFVNASEPSDYIELQFCDEYREGYFEFILDGEEWFNNTKNQGTSIVNYGIVGHCNYDTDSYPLIDFLKQLMNKYPEILVFYEYPQKGIPYYIYNKEQLETF